MRRAESESNEQEKGWNPSVRLELKCGRGIFRQQRKLTLSKAEGSRARDPGFPRGAVLDTQDLTYRGRWPPVLKEARVRPPACCRGRGFGAPLAAAPSSCPGRPLGSLLESVCHWYLWKTVVDVRDLSAPPACLPPALLVPVTKRGLPRRPAFRPVAR